MRRTTEKDKFLLMADNIYNIGDLALLRQVVFGIRSLTGLTDIVIRQWEAPADTMLRQFSDEGCQLGQTKWHFLFAPGRIAIVSGGQFIRNNVSITSLLFMILTLATSNRPAAALAIGGGAVRGCLRRWLWRVLLAKFYIITFRDELSMALVKDLLPDRVRCDVTCDLAFLQSPLHDALIARQSERVVVVAPCFSEAENRLIDVAWVANIGAAMAVYFDVNSVSIVPHDSRPEMDRRICVKIVNEFTDIGGLEVDFLSDCTLDRAVEIYREASVVLTNRLHSMIFALLAGKPVLVIDDSNPKLQAYANRFFVKLLPQGCDLDELKEALACEADPQVRAKRAEAISFARAEASRNFQMLHDACT